ncbi:UNVERIFIED_CONTAM: hypothetical protein Scaly_1054400 [Sesamum calycinum]|uniref:rRNA-processing protein EFG1 n=1 Tax=Sesamum calycinum TaxID=2727403 RepID=A0AAW2QKP4_9LAMI
MLRTLYVDIVVAHLEHRYSGNSVKGRKIGRLYSDLLVDYRDNNSDIIVAERRKVERRIRRLEKQQRASTGQAQEAEIAEQLTKLKEDLEYVRQIKANLIAAAASGKDLEETGSEDDGLLDPSEDDFFLNGSSSDDADADDEWSARDQASSASGKAASGMSSDERNQRQISARALMPPPGPSGKPFSSSAKNKSRFAGSSSKKPYNRAEISTSSNVQ